MKIRAVTEWVEPYLYSHYVSLDVDRNKFIHIKQCVRECIQAVDKKKKDFNFLARRDPDLAQSIPYPNRYINYAALQKARNAMCV